MKHTNIRWLSAAAILLMPILLWAQPQPKLFQEETTLQKERGVLLRRNDSSSRMTKTEELFLFPNVNNTKYYYDKKMYAQLKQALRDNNISFLSSNLPDYISKFGIQNFVKDADLIWQAGRLYELYGDSEKAVFFYELALLHGARTPERLIMLDSLEMRKRARWTTIDEYYKMFNVRKKVDNFITTKSAIKSMGKEINSNEPDYAPFMHPTDSVILFSSRRGADNVVDPFQAPNEDLYYSVIDFMTGKWMYSQKFPASISSMYNEGSACLSSDGKTLYFSRCDAKDSKGDCDLYVSQFLGEGKWSEPENLGIYINSEGWDSHPFISPNGRILFFASDRVGGFGGTDLYYSLLQNGKWTMAQSCGPFINTARNEVTPYLHHINLTLYFGSNGQLHSFGGYDVYKSTWTGSRWSSPANLGPIANSEGDEYYFSLDSEGNNIFFSRTVDAQQSEQGENYDIFYFPMPMEARPNANTQLKGVVIDSVTGNRLTGRVMIIDLDNGIEISPKATTRNGEFDFDLVKNNRYRLYVMGDNFYTVKNDLYLSKDSVCQVFAKCIEEGKPIIFETLEFKPNSFQLKPGAKPRMDYLITFLKRYPEYNLLIEGHTDSDGDPETNKTLSMKRAQMIGEYITDAKIPKYRVKAIGYGDKRPLVPNDTKENKRINRRVEFKLYLNEDSIHSGNPLPTEGELKEEPVRDTFDPDAFMSEFERKEENASPDAPPGSTVPNMPARIGDPTPSVSTDPFRTATSAPVDPSLADPTLDDLDIERETEMWDDIPTEDDLSDDLDLEGMGDDLFDDADLERSLEDGIEGELDIKLEGDTPSGDGLFDDTDGD